MALITINGISLDPVADAPALQAAHLVAADASQSNYILVQTAAPLTSEQKAQLRALKVVIHEYVSDNTYLCGYYPTDLAAIRRLPFVVWVNVYMRGFKIAPDLRPPESDAARYIVPPVVGPSVSRSLRTVDVVLHDDVDPHSDRIRKEIAAAAGLNPEQLKSGRRKVQLTLEENRLEDLAALDEVRRIKEVKPVQLCNNVARTILNASVVVTGTTYEGDGQVIAIADTGFDKGSTTSVHPAFAGRVVHLYPLGRTTPPMTDDPNGHGTHVAGSALGDGSSSTMGGSIQGTAPKAKLVLQSLLDSKGGLGGVPFDLNDLFDPPYSDHGARVHSNSWTNANPDGSPAFSVPYSGSRADEIDQFVWTHQDCVICFAAGNDAPDSNGDGVVDLGSLGGEAAAKNCITVGSTENNRPELHVHPYGKLFKGFPANPIHDDHVANHPEGMAATSRRGPTREKRFKPDVVAPGTCILSTRSSNLAKPITAFGTSSDSHFFFDYGTSMATALVAGCCAVLRETLVKNGVPVPSAALIKALLVNGAVELVGQYSPSEAGPSPNNNSGFGRVDLAGSVIIPGPNPNGGFGDGGPLKEGEEATIEVMIPPPGDAAHGGGAGAPSGGASGGSAPSSPASPPAPGGGGGGGGSGASPTFKVTLVWSDPPGDALQNDLDLIVVASDGNERHGNMGASTNFDRLNNVEQVLWKNIPTGLAKITVRAVRITNFPQPFAYAWRIS